MTGVQTCALPICGTNQVPTIAQTLTSGGNGKRGYLDPVNTTMVVFDRQHSDEYGEGSENVGGNNVPFAGVRRLMPIECERLQGFPDGWTDGQSDSARYRQLGNAVAVPVVEWIGKRIVKAEQRLTKPAPDAWESAPFQAAANASADSTSQTLSTPTKRR